MPTLQKQKSPPKAKKKTAAKGGKKSTKNNEKVVDIKEEEINLTCTHCNKTFTTEAGLLYHMGKSCYVFFVCMECYEVQPCLPHIHVYSPFPIHIYFNL